jgi:hypothetical protein
MSSCGRLFFCDDREKAKVYNTDRLTAHRQAMCENENFKDKFKWSLVVAK